MSMLKSIREKKGLTLGQLAARSSIPSRVLAEYEEGHQVLPLAHAKLLAKALWVQIEDLMPPAGSEPPTPPRPAPPPQYAPIPAPAPPSPRPAPPAGDSPQHAPYTPPPAAPQAHAPAPQPYGGQHPAPPQGGSGGYQPARAPQQPYQQPRPQPSQPQGGRSQGGSAQGRPLRTRPAPPPPKPVTEGQSEELTRLAARLDISPADLETRLGKPVSALVRTEAKDWIKKLREMANEVAPSHKVRYGLWPGAREDQEAAYLGQKRDEGAQLAFKLFNGDEVSGTISEFTPYTITLTTAAGDTMVLRKLAVVYYRQTAAGTGPATAKVGEASGDHLHEPEVDSDRAGEPAAPEADNMDRDRGV